MNPKLIKFIELCLVDGVISDKEREVIFRKSKEFGVPEDECEIILEGMIQKLGKKQSSDQKSLNTESLKKIKSNTSTKDNGNHSEINHNKQDKLVSKQEPIPVELSEDDNVKENIEINQGEKVELGEKKTSTERIRNGKQSEIDKKQIDKELFQILQNNNSKLLKKVETFLNKLKYSVRREDFLYSERFNIYLRTYSLSTFKLTETLYKGEERDQFSCVYYRDKNMNSFHIRYFGYISKEETFYEKTILGGTREKKQTTLDFEDCYYFPFVDSFENIPVNLHQREINTFVEVEGFKKFINNIEHLNPNSIEYDKIEPVLEFIDDTILSFNQSMGKTKNKITNEINLLDQDNNGTIDVIEGNDDFINLFKKHQKKITEVDKNYIQHFVKLSNYIKTKRENLQNIFTSLRESSDLTDMEDLLGILKNQIHSYEVVLFHSLNMITSVVEDDLITFYEIYEEFDKLKMFKSDHEEEVSQKLSDIGDGLSNLMYSINSMERNIVGGLNKLSYVTQEGFSDLNNSVTRELNSIDSSIKFNNLLTGIQTYQMYKINKNTKGLRE